jgi:tetratricopeptide (TPR) repeat protein
MENVSEIVARGKQHFDHRQYDQAERYLKSALDQKVRYADVYNMLGVISHSAGRFASAIEFFREALKINPNYTEAVMNLAVLYNDLGQYPKARALYERLHRRRFREGQKIEPVLRGKLSNLHADIGDIYRSTGLHHLAIDEYQKALKLNPNYFDIRTKLGQAYREGGHLPKAVQEFKSVLKSNSGYSPALLQLGVTYYVLGKLDEAKRNWKKVLSRDPNNEYAQMYLRLCQATEHTKLTKPKAASPKTRAGRTKRKAKGSRRAKGKTKK